MSSAGATAGGVIGRLGGWPFVVALRACMRAAPVTTAAMALVSLLFGLVPLALYVTVSLFAGDVAADPGAVRLDLWVPVIVAIVFLLQLSSPVLSLLNEYLGRHVDRWAQRRVMAAALGPDTIAHLDTPDFRDAAELAHAWEASSFPPRDAVYSMLEIFRALVVAAGSIVLLAGFSWWVPIAIASGFILMTVWGTRTRETDAAGAGRRQTGLRRAHYLRDQAFEPASGREARVFGLGAWFQDRAHAAWTEAMTPLWRDRAGTRKAALLTIAVLIGSHLLVLGLIMASALDGHVTVTQAALYLQGAGGLVNFWFPWHVVTLREATRPLVAIERLPLAPRAAESELPAVPGDSALQAPAADIAFEDVTFRYPGTAHAVFDGLNLRIHAGAALGIVGVNGAGKTTLVKLLAGLLDPDAGRITVGGMDIRTIRPAWQADVAAIFQDYVRYPFTARDNVVLGRPTTDQDAAERAVSRAMADDVVDRLATGLDTQLGREFGGVDLSGGQWQRIALARALYGVERGARVLVLDEPTAQLDVRAEAALFDRFLDLTAGLTTVLISHRFSSVRHAHRIVVLEEGRVIEDGSHDALVAAGGRYAHLFAQQARHFEAPDG